MLPLCPVDVVVLLLRCSCDSDVVVVVYLLSLWFCVLVLISSLVSFCHSVVVVS